VFKYKCSSERFKNLIFIYLQFRLKNVCVTSFPKLEIDYKH
jgi:hypothetical protein